MKRVAKKKILLVLLSVTLLVSAGGLIYKIHNTGKDKSSISKKIDSKTESKGISQNSSSTKYKNNGINHQPTNNLNKNNAVKSVKSFLKNTNVNTTLSVDHEEKREGVDYYVVHVFDKMSDHVATSGWYYVNKSNGDVYELDIATNNLKKISK